MTFMVFTPITSPSCRDRAHYSLAQTHSRKWGYLNKSSREYWGVGETWLDSGRQPTGNCSEI